MIRHGTVSTLRLSYEMSCSETTLMLPMQMKTSHPWASIRNAQAPMRKNKVLNFDHVSDGTSNHLANRGWSRHLSYLHFQQRPRQGGSLRRFRQCKLSSHCSYRQWKHRLQWGQYPLRLKMMKTKILEITNRWQQSRKLIRCTVVTKNTKRLKGEMKRR